MSFELFVALRYLFSRRKQTFIYIISLMSILGVALGVGALVLVLGVYNGLTADMRDKILGANAHGIVMSHLPSAFEHDATLTERIASVSGVVAAMPFIYTEVMLSAGNGVKGVVLRGVNPTEAPAVLSMLRQIKLGSVSGMQKEGVPGIIIGEELARRLGLGLASRVNLLSPSGQKSSSGYSPRIRPFEVAGIFKTGMFEYDSSLAFVSLDAARDVLGMSAGFLSGIEITVADVYEADKTAALLTEALGPPFYVRTWMEMNANLFAALKLEKVGMFILLAMVVLIGSFSIVTSLVMLVMEKTRDIAIMLSMGATHGMIRRIFIYQGTIIGLVGTLLGYVFGLTLGEILKRYQFIRLPDNVYTVDHLPILITMSDVCIVGASAMLLCFLATLYPARQAARLQPAEALRYE
ncbi:MAG: lipoprotein releasing system transmembrane protein [Candidatus Desulfovibrio kirbyi]|jgi:lipoprotein-releasing system permease protein|uniref:Lipoprotein releasing system transmembrane protein n=1 Tax=Candidatus Desulfovibrio kirbyi TaxID=2696086 RepID=A0A6L2R4H4_9BACT|nr:MAG: lipoprotein releasing system transmembrane protein [Candidatus Desulfovibrio kirbyi]